MVNIEALLPIKAGLTGVIQAVGPSGPAKRDVIRELHRILNNDPNFSRPPAIHWRLPTRSYNLLGALREPWLIILVITILVVLYFLLKMASPYIQGRPQNDLSKKENLKKAKKRPRQPYTELYRQALEESKAHHYREAIISLHKSTVEYLLNEAIMTKSHRKYSNNDLKRMLRNNGLFEPFCVITGHAEIAGFSAAELGAAHFKRVLDVFEQSFLALIEREE